MKKIGMIMIILGALIITGCAPKTYDEIDSKTLDKMVENKEDFVLFIGSTTCSACSSFKITVNEIVKNSGVDIKYIDISKLTEQQKEELLQKFPFNATPTTVLVKKE